MPENREFSFRILVGKVPLPEYKQDHKCYVECNLCTPVSYKRDIVEYVNGEREQQKCPVTPYEVEIKVNDNFNDVHYYKVFVDGVKVKGLSLDRGKYKIVNGFRDGGVIREFLFSMPRFAMDECDRISESRIAEVGTIKIECWTAKLQNRQWKITNKNLQFQQANKKDSSKITKGSYFMATSKAGDKVKDRQVHRRIDQWHKERLISILRVDYRMPETLANMGFKLIPINWTQQRKQSRSEDKGNDKETSVFALDHFEPPQYLGDKRLVRCGRNRWKVCSDDDSPVRKKSFCQGSTGKSQENVQASSSVKSVKPHDSESKATTSSEVHNKSVYHSKTDNEENKKKTCLKINQNVGRVSQSYYKMRRQWPNMNRIFNYHDMIYPWRHPSEYGNPDRNTYFQDRYHWHRQYNNFHHSFNYDNRNQNTYAKAQRAGVSNKSQKRKSNPSSNTENPVESSNDNGTSQSETVDLAYTSVDHDNEYEVELTSQDTQRGSSKPNDNGKNIHYETVDDSDHSNHTEDTVTVKKHGNQNNTEGNHLINQSEVIDDRLVSASSTPKRSAEESESLIHMEISDTSGSCELNETNYSNATDLLATRPVSDSGTENKNKNIQYFLSQKDENQNVLVKAEIHNKTTVPNKLESTSNFSHISTSAVKTGKFDQNLFSPGSTDTGNVTESTEVYKIDPTTESSMIKNIWPLYSINDKENLLVSNSNGNGVSKVISTSYDRKSIIVPDIKLELIEVPTMSTDYGSDLEIIDFTHGQV